MRAAWSRSSNRWAKTFKNHKTRERTTTKTASSTRTVILMPALGRTLAAHRLASEFSSDSDPVFTTAVGSAVNRDNVRNRILAPAVKLAGEIVTAPFTRAA